MVNFGITALAMLYELVFGYPDKLVRWIGHPVIWIGALISRLDRLWNRSDRPSGARRARGVAAIIIVLAAAAVPALLLQLAFGAFPFGILIIALLASSLIAQRSLHWHVAQVAAALDTSNIDAARSAVSRIVGRDPKVLDAHGVARAAIESLAENFSDGVVAPVFWMAIGGLPGGAAYKAANTADSMIGHLNEKHRDFGWAAARLDDLVNLPASRLAGLLLVGAASFLPGASPAGAWRAMGRDARRHRSPNAGWPEAAMAGALGLKLNGPKVYGGTPTEDAYMGDGRRDATAKDVRRALMLYRRADALLLALVSALTLAAIIWQG